MIILSSSSHRKAFAQVKTSSLPSSPTKLGPCRNLEEFRAEISLMKNQSFGIRKSNEGGRPVKEQMTKCLADVIGSERFQKGDKYMEEVVCSPLVAKSARSAQQVSDRSGTRGEKHVVLLDNEAFPDRVEDSKRQLSLLGQSFKGVVPLQPGTKIEDSKQVSTTNENWEIANLKDAPIEGRIKGEAEEKQPLLGLHDKISVLPLLNPSCCELDEDKIGFPR